MPAPFYKLKELGPTVDLLSKQYSYMAVAPESEIEICWEQIVQLCFEIANTLYPEYLHLIDDVVATITCIDDKEKALDILGGMYVYGYSNVTDWELS